VRGFALGVTVSAAVVLACTPAATPAAAEAAFTADLLHCVDKAATLAESKACRAEVHQRWGIVETLRDGGVE